MGEQQSRHVLSFHAPKSLEKKSLELCSEALRLISNVYNVGMMSGANIVATLERIEGERAKQSKSRREHVIRYEVDMALALSAKGFTWSSALRSKLEKERDLAIKKPAHIIQFQSSEIEGNMRFLLFPQLKGNLNIHYSSTAPNKYCIHKKFCEYYSDPCTVKGNLGKVVYDKRWLHNELRVKSFEAGISLKLLQCSKQSPARDGSEFKLLPG
ncbi:hypothetical protein SUGI_0773520 [Cryptomeria japonica]|nr:hypothetical protein SUGI_0773520 [Cryptomeria japonica]